MLLCVYPCSERAEVHCAVWLANKAVCECRDLSLASSAVFIAYMCRPFSPYFVNGLLYVMFDPVKLVV